MLPLTVKHASKAFSASRDFSAEAMAISDLGDPDVGFLLNYNLVRGQINPKLGKSKRATELKL